MSERIPTTQRRRTARPKTPQELSRAFPISIVIPFRNSAEHLPRVLRALAENDLRETEVWLIDDASEDGGGETAEAFELGTQRKWIRLSQRSGPAVARNRGLSEARHPYVLFLDSDILLPPKSLFWIRESLDIYRHRPEIRGVLGVYSSEAPSRDFFTNYKNLYIRYLYDTTETASPFIHTPIFCVHKETLRGVGGFDGRLETAEDFRLGVLLGSRGFRFVIDRRIESLHLKTYTATSILREDRRRVSDLRRLELAQDQRQFYYRAHRPARLLSLVLPSLILAGFLTSPWFPEVLPAAFFFLILFLALNFRFFNFCRKKRGWLFALATIAFFSLEMTWAGCVSLESLVRHDRLGGGEEEGSKLEV